MLFCCIILMFAFGCRKSNNNNNNGNQNATDIFPNKVGDTWLYLVNDTTVNRSTPHDSTAVQYNLTVSVIDSIQLPGGIKANVWVYTYPGEDRHKLRVSKRRHYPFHRYQSNSLFHLCKAVYYSSKPS